MIDIHSKNQVFNAKFGLPERIKLKLSINVEDLKTAYREHYTYEDLCQIIGSEILEALKGPLE